MTERCTYYLNSRYVHKVLERVHKETGYNIKSSDNNYHVLVKTGKEGVHKYSPAAFELIKKIINGQKYKLKPWLVRTMTLCKRAACGILFSQAAFLHNVWHIIRTNIQIAGFYKFLVMVAHMLTRLRLAQPDKHRNEFRHFVAFLNGLSSLLQSVCDYAERMAMLLRHRLRHGKASATTQAG